MIFSGKKKISALKAATILILIVVTH
jgi:hypothetical protein